MDIYIKSFNRPFLLDKCLASIKMFAKNFSGNIVIMDDGTPQKYLDKIKNNFPDIIIKKSEFYELKSKAIENDLDVIKNIPSIFWKETVAKGSEYFVVIEDDCWFCETIDFLDIENQMKIFNLNLIKLLWMNNEALISDQIEIKTNSLIITKPKLFTRNSFLFDLIYRKKTAKINVILYRLGVPIEENLLNYYQVYAVANAFFSKQYYLNAWETTQNKIDELAQIQQVIQMPREELNVAHSEKEWIKTSLKTTASKQNKENFNSNFDVYFLNKILNETWFQNQFEDYDFEKDISDDFILKVIQTNHLGIETFNQWQNWYYELKQKYAAIGCEISYDR